MTARAKYNTSDNAARLLAGNALTNFVTRLQDIWVPFRWIFFNSVTSTVLLCRNVVPPSLQTLQMPLLAQRCRAVVAGRPTTDQQPPTPTRPTRARQKVVSTCGAQQCAPANRRGVHCDAVDWPATAHAMARRLQRCEIKVAKKNLSLPGIKRCGVARARRDSNSSMRH